LRDAVWKFLLVALVVLAFAPSLTPYGEHVKNFEQEREFRAEVLRGEHDEMLEDPAFVVPADLSLTELREQVVGAPLPGPEDMALSEMYAFYILGGALALVPLAWLLGATLIAGEVGDGTILLLLSRPVSRARMLLTKYAVCAGTLLVAVVLGTALILGLAALRGYPLGEVDAARMALAGAIMWLGSLFALALSLLASVASRNVLVSLGFSALVLFLVASFPYNLVGVIDSFRSSVYYSDEPYAWLEVLGPSSYWLDQELLNIGAPEVQGLYLPGPGIPIAAKLLFWTFGAGAMLLASLWLFRRRAF